MSTSCYYDIFGLSLQADRPIPGLRPGAKLGVVDLEVCLGDWPDGVRRLAAAPGAVWYVSSYADDHGEPSYQIWQLAGGYLRWRFSDDVEFVVDQARTRLWVRWPEAVTLEYVAPYLLGPVLGTLLRFRGIICLHGSAIAVDHQALALLGPPGAGKSTTAAAFAMHGFSVLTDDIIALTEMGRLFIAHPGEPNLCLWPASVASLFGHPEALPLVVPDNTLAPEWNKRYLDLSTPDYRFQSQPLLLAAIYLLGARREGDGPFVERVSGREVMLGLLANTYGSNLLNRTLRAHEFETLNRLAAGVPVRRVLPREDPAYLTRLCEVILDDFRSLSVSVPCGVSD